VHHDCESELVCEKAPKAGMKPFAKYILAERNFQRKEEISYAVFIR
jgi:hypothetical protein